MPARIIAALLLFFSVSWAIAQSAPPALAEGAPDHYTVVAGDTMWGIAKKFLKEPWRWKEIWRANSKDGASPNRLYPGQVLILDLSGVSPVVKTGESVVKLSPLIHEDVKPNAIPAISPKVIGPFLSEPRIVEPASLVNAPQIVATEENRLFLGVGNLAYAAGIKGEDKYWQAFRPAAPIKDPENDQVLGFESFYVGNLQVTRPGDPTTMTIITAKREIGEGDLLMPAARADVPSFIPHSPEKDIRGQIASIYEGVGETGKSAIVTLNRGKSQGLEVGHVLALYREGRLASYKGATGSDKPKEYRLPAERFGLVFVFRVFERISYALVMETSRPVMVGDQVRTP